MPRAMDDVGRTLGEQRGDRRQPTRAMSFPCDAHPPDADVAWYRAGRRRGAAGRHVPLALSAPRQRRTATTGSTTGAARAHGRSRPAGRARDRGALHVDLSSWRSRSSADQARDARAAGRGGALRELRRDGIWAVAAAGRQPPRREAARALLATHAAIVRGALTGPGSISSAMRRQLLNLEDARRSDGGDLSRRTFPAGGVRAECRQHGRRRAEGIRVGELA